MSGLARRKDSARGMGLLEAKGKEGERPPEVVVLDPLIHERTRLAILTILSTSSTHSLSFHDIREILGLTDGNLMAHLRTLEVGGLLLREKKGAGRGSCTTIHLTSMGRDSFSAYLNSLELLIQTARSKGEHPSF